LFLVQLLFHQLYHWINFFFVSWSSFNFFNRKSLIIKIIHVLHKSRKVKMELKWLSVISSIPLSTHCLPHWDHLDTAGFEDHYDPMTCPYETAERNDHMETMSLWEVQGECSPWAWRCRYIFISSSEWTWPTSEHSWCCPSVGGRDAGGREEDSRGLCHVTWGMPMVMAASSWKKGP
jgi:hypothetical protein